MKKITILSLFMWVVCGHAQVSNYTFTSSNGTYSDIGTSTGTQLGNTSSDNQYYVDPTNLLGTTPAPANGTGFDIGFDFVFNGITYNKFGVANDGWISLGSTSITPDNVNMYGGTTDRFLPISGTTTVPDNLCMRIAAFATNIKAQAATSTQDASDLRFLMSGNPGQRVLVVQWKNYLKGFDGDSDRFNFQIRLYETTNVIQIVYGTFACNLTPNIQCQVGLRAAPTAIASNFSNITSTTGWGNAVAGKAATDALPLTSTSFPQSGLTYTWTPPTFGGAKGLTATAITPQSETISWGSYDPAPGGFEYIYSTSSALPTGSGTSTTATSANLSSLNPNTFYNVFIRTFSGSQFSPWLFMGRFKTNCFDATEFFEDFDTYPGIQFGGILPDCWSSANSDTGSYVEIRNQDSSNRLTLNSSSPSTFANAVLPSVSNLKASDHRLRFKAYASTDSKQVAIGYFDSQGNFVTGEIKDLTTKGVANEQEFTITPSSWSITIPSVVKNLVIRALSSSNYAAVYIDNVIWEPIPQPCAAKIKSPLANMITANSAVLNWAQGSYETAWQYVYAPASATNPYALQGINVSGTLPTVALSGLDPATSYKAWIRSKCDDGSLGSWVGPVNFNTACTSGTEISENFDAQSSTNVLPSCWRMVGTSGAVSIGTSGTMPSSPNYLQLNGGTTAGSSYTMIALPPMSNTGAANHQITYKAAVTVANTTQPQVQLTIGWMSDVSDPTTFHELVTVSDLTKNTYTYHYHSLGSVPASAYLAFKNPGNIANGHVLIDDVVWEPLPVCTSTVLPSLASMTVATVNSTKTKLSWVTNGSENAWQYVAMPATATNPYSFDALNVASPVKTYNSVEAVISGLTPNTAYKIWLRSKCGDTSFGIWNGPILVTTPCAPVTEFSQNFDSVAAIPSCWATIGKGASSVKSDPAMASQSYPYMLNMTGNATTNPAVVAMPGVSNMGAGTHRLRFKYMSSAAGGILDIGYLLRPADPNSFTSLLTSQNLQLITCTGTAQDYTLVFPYNAELADIETLAFKNTGSVASKIFIDDVYWEAIPPCPDVISPTVSAITDSSFSLSWTKGTPDQTLWQYAVGTMDAADPSSSYIFTATDTPQVVVTGTTPNTPLLPNTGYKIWVRSNCIANPPGSWIQVITKTRCSAISDFSEDFNIATALPQCWKVMGTGTGSLTTTFVEKADGKKLFIKNGADAAAYTVVAMPTLNNANATDHILKFKFRGSNVGDKIEVGYLTNIADPTSFYSALPNKLEFVATSTDLSDLETVYLGANPISNVVVFRIAGANTGIYLDNVSWAVAPTTRPACVTAQATPDAKCGNFATTISWPALAGADYYKLDIGTASGTADVIHDLNLGSALSYSFIGNNKTTYYYNIKAVNYVGIAVGCDVQWFVTNDNHCYCTSTSAIVDGDGITHLQLGATDFDNSGAGYKDFTLKSVDLAQGQSTNLQLSFSTAGHVYSTFVWIDFNNDYVFDDSEKVFTGAPLNYSPDTLNASFTMPDDAQLGVHRMRIIAGPASDSSFFSDPCYNGVRSVTLDFNVNLVPAPVLGAAMFNENHFACYPNPVKDVLNISFDQQISDVTVFNLLGQQLMAKSINANQAKVDVSGLSKGTYLVKINTDSQSKTVKVIRQ